MKTTHVGSLPYLSIEEAVSFNLGLSLPALPTLPKLYESEWMINQFTSGFMQNDHELSFSCFEEFFKVFNGKVKVQVCGVQTLYNNSPEHIDKEQFKDWYLLMVRKFIQKIPNEFILFFDEPDLRNSNKTLWSVYDSFCDFELGLHCCSVFNPAELDLSIFSSLSFDLNIMNHKDISLLKKMDKELIYGCINTRSAEMTKNLQLLQTDYISPCCGLALTDSVTTQKILDLLRDSSK